MSALKMERALDQIERNMSRIAPDRKPALFNEFLVKGYTAVTLSSVPSDQFLELLRAKLYLGTLITLYDDFADRPSQKNPELLNSLYQLDFLNGESVRMKNEKENEILDFARSLFEQIQEVLRRQPHYQDFIEILNFDLRQFYSANQYSSLLTAHPYLHNPLENRLYAHHNMGMVVVSMMDLMATPEINLLEFGAIREVLLMGQRLGRIFNVLVTRRREALDGDITGELAACRSKAEIRLAERQLRQEICELYQKIERLDCRIKSFSVKAYLQGLLSVQKLHEKMEGFL